MFNSMLIATALASLSAVQPQFAAPISYAVKKVAGTWIHVVEVDPSNDAVKVSGVTSRHWGTAEPVWSLVSRANPTVAITGTFHSVSSKMPVGDIVIDGQCVHRGDFPSCLAVDWYDRPKIVSCAWGERQDWRDYEYLLGGGIRIVRGGHVNPDISHRRDHHVFLPNPRTAAGVTKGKKLLLVATRERVTLTRLGIIMRDLGARDAISLDGGSSVCLYYRGRMLVPAHRRLTNLLVVYDRPDVYRSRKAELGPKIVQKNARR